MSSSDDEGSLRVLGDGRKALVVETLQCLEKVKSMNPNDVLAVVAQGPRYQLPQSYQFPPHCSSTKKRFYVLNKAVRERGIYFGFSALKALPAYSSFTRGEFIGFESLEEAIGVYIRKLGEVPVLWAAAPCFNDDDGEVGRRL